MYVTAVVGRKCPMSAIRSYLPRSNLFLYYQLLACVAFLHSILPLTLLVIGSEYELQLFIYGYIREHELDWSHEL